MASVVERGEASATQGVKIALADSTSLRKSFHLSANPTTSDDGEIERHRTIWSPKP